MDRHIGKIGLGAFLALAVTALAAGTAQASSRLPEPSPAVTAPVAAGFADVVETASPAVVSVRVTGQAQGAARARPAVPELPEGHPMERFFRQFPAPAPSGRTFTSQGSGFFVTGDGYLVTNDHVVRGGLSFSVQTSDGRTLDAVLVGTDSRTDLAVLKVEGEDFPHLAFADDSQVRVGDWVVAIGNPFGLGGTVTAGIVSARGRDIGTGPYDDFIQIDAAVNRGNSGGPALNLAGEVVGVNTAIFSPSGGNVGIAFAVPSGLARTVVEGILETGTVRRGWLGVNIQRVTEAAAEALGLEGTDGALVLDASEGGPGAEAGLMAGDVILSVDGQAVAGPRELARIVGSLRPGHVAELALWRDGRDETLGVALGELDDGDARQAELLLPDVPPAAWLDGYGVRTETADGALTVVEVEEGGIGSVAGLREGDAVVTANSSPVASREDLESAVAAARDAGRNAILLRIRRGGAYLFVPLPVNPD